MKAFIRSMAVVTLLTGPAAFADPQPKMQEALEHLKAAKAALQAATSDKGGHRVKAIDKVNDAIEQVEKGIAVDNKR